MKFEAYQQQARKTALFPGNGTLTMASVTYCVTALQGEVGELAQVVLAEQKYMLAGRRSSLVKTVDELGDVCWYTTALCSEFGIALTWVAEQALLSFADDFSSVALTNVDAFQKNMYLGHSYPERHKPNGLAMATLELTNCAGAIANANKKQLRGDYTPTQLEIMVRECLPALLTTCVAVCDEINIQFSLVLQFNLDKLELRQARNTIQDTGGRDENS